MNDDVKSIFTDMFTSHPVLRCCREAVAEVFGLLRQCYLKGGKLLVCGNGGCAADAEHIVGELMKGFLLNRVINKTAAGKFISFFPEDGECLAGKLQGALPAISLVSQTALMTAVINDTGADMIFAQQVYGYGKAGDVLIGLSTSGNSENIVNAVKVARALDIISVGITGHGGGCLKTYCDHVIQVPANETYRAQELFQPVYHVLCAMIESEFFGSAQVFKSDTSNLP